MRRLIALVAVAVCAAGCVNVPTGGRVVSGQAVERAAPFDDPYVRLIPVPPGRDWLPEQIVRGFLTASASFDDGHAVASMYLAQSAEWEPGPRPEVKVYDGSLNFGQLDVDSGEATSTMQMQVTGTQLGTIGADGQYEARSGRVDHTFQLAKGANGQWRITEMPYGLRHGVLLGQRDVERAFRTLNLYFFAPDRTVLVPNPIFLPLVNRRDLPRQLVRAELTGPTNWLGEAVRSEVPRGTRLLGDTVDVTDGVATVNLSKEAAKGSLSGMSAQLMWTLRQLPEVTGMRLQIDGETVSPPGKGATQTPGDWRNNDADLTPSQTVQRAYLRDDNGRFQQLSGDTVSDIEATGGVPLYHPAVSLDERSVAGLNESGDAVLAGDIGAAPRVVLRAGQGGHFTAPTWDRTGTFWVVENDGRGKSRLWLKEPGKGPIEATLWGLSGRTVTALRVARDGVRVAAIADMNGQSQVQIGRIIKDQGGTRSPSFFLPISSEIADATDLAWRDANELAVLGRTQREAEVAPYLVPVSGGAIRKFGTGGGDMTSITALPGAPVLVGMKVTDENTNKIDDRICRQQDESDPLSGWTLCRPLGHDPAYPG